jgi:hypothetical protein
VRTGVDGNENMGAPWAATPCWQSLMTQATGRDVEGADSGQSIEEHEGQKIVSIHPVVNIKEGEQTYRGGNGRSSARQRSGVEIHRQQGTSQHGMAFGHAMATVCKTNKILLESFASPWVRWVCYLAQLSHRCFLIQPNQDAFYTTIVSASLVHLVMRHIG